MRVGSKTIQREIEEKKKSLTQLKEYVDRKQQDIEEAEQKIEILECEVYDLGVTAEFLLENKL